jgi:Lrp/AsnC family transcriptional regulator, regulator for asnA, asnC and gidA
LDYQIDEMDRRIIKLLSKDGRMPFTELAAQLKVTEKTVRLRYKNLVENEILKVMGYINAPSLNLNTSAIIQLKVLPQKINDAVKELKTLRDIRYITMTSGPYSLLVQVVVPTQIALTQILHQINGIAHITEMNTIIQLEVYKNTFDFFEGEESE